MLVQAVLSRLLTTIFLTQPLKRHCNPSTFYLIFFLYGTARYKIGFPQGEKEKSFGAIIAARDSFQFAARFACMHWLKKGYSLKETRMPRVAHSVASHRLEATKWALPVPPRLNGRVRPEA